MDVKFTDKIDLRGRENREVDQSQVLNLELITDEAERAEIQRNLSEFLVSSQDKGLSVTQCSTRLFADIDDPTKGDDPTKVLMSLVKESEGEELICSAVAGEGKDKKLYFWITKK